MKLFSLDNVFATVFVIVVITYFSVIFNANVFDPIQSTFEDLELTDIVFSKFYDSTNVSLDTNIVIINNGNTTRKALANQLEIINRYQPKVVGIDAFFKQKSSRPDFDSALAYQFSQTKNLVLVVGLRQPNADKDYFDTVIKSNPIFTKYAQDGFANVITDTKNFRTVRETTPQQYVKDTLKYSFPVKIASLYNKSAVDKLLARGNEKELINYRRNTNRYRTLDVFDVFEKQDSLQFLKDKIVLIGYMGPNMKTKVTEDIFFSPLNPNYVGKTHPDMYGVVIHANVISMILEGKYINMTPDWLEKVLSVLIIFFNMVIFTYLRNNYEQNSQAISVVLLIAEVAAIVIISLYSIYTFKLELNIMGAIVGLLFSISAYEAYNDSLKPLVLTGYRYILKLFKITPTTTEGAE